MIDYKKQGKKNRAAGKAFETKVRKKLEVDGWIVCKWQNQVNIISVDPEDGIGGEMVPCRAKFNPFTRSMMMISGGFPDFIAFRLIRGMQDIMGSYNEFGKTKSQTTTFDLRKYGWYEIIGVESKSNGTLKPEEKQKCEWYLQEKIFSKILIARKGEKRGQIIFEEFKK